MTWKRSVASAFGALVLVGLVWSLGADPVSAAEAETGILDEDDGPFGIVDEDGDGTTRMEGIVVVTENSVESHDTITFWVAGPSQDFAIVVKPDVDSTDEIARLEIAVGAGGDCSAVGPVLDIVVNNSGARCLVTWDPAANTVTDLVVAMAEGPDAPGGVLSLLLDSIRTGTLTVQRPGTAERPQGWQVERDYLVHYCTEFDGGSSEPGAASA